MMILKNLEVSDAEKIVQWNQNKDEKFLHQWAGKKAYVFPISVEQIMNRRDFGENEIFVLAFNDKTVGTIELGWRDRDNNIMRFGRFLIDANLRGKGYGQMAIQLIEEKAFGEYKASFLELGVYEYNQTAKSLYEKLGYSIVDTEINIKDKSLSLHTMRKYR